jgi:hypothetical protein
MEAAEECLLLRLKADMQVGDGPFVGLGIGSRAYVFQYEVLGWPVDGHVVILRDMRATGEPGRWRVSRDHCVTWAGDFESAEHARESLEAELRDTGQPR